MRQVCRYLATMVYWTFLADCQFEVENCTCLLNSFDTPLCMDIFMTDFQTNVTFQEVTKSRGMDEALALIQYIGRYGNCDQVNTIQQKVPIIDKCSDDFTGPRADREECESPDLQLPPLDYQGTLKLTFKNIFCARCHGNSDQFVRNKFKPWILDLNCLGSDKLTVNRTMCGVMYKPPTPVSICRIYSLKDNIKNNLCWKDLNLTDDSFVSRICKLNEYLEKFSISCKGSIDSGTNGDDLTKLFRLPIESTDRVQFNGKLLKASSICQPNENFDAFFQVCRRFVCTAGFYPNLGKCHQNSTLYLPAETQPFPEGSRELSLNIVVTLLYNHSIDYINQFLTEIGSTMLHGFMYVYGPISEGWSKHEAEIRFNISQTFFEEFFIQLSEIELFIYKGVSSEYRLGNNVSEIVHKTCPDQHYDINCTRDIQLDYIKESIYVQIISEERIIYVALEHVYFDILMTYPNPEIDLIEICYCHPIAGAFTPNCTSELYEFQSSEYQIDPEDDTLEILSTNAKVTSSSYYLTNNNTAFVCLEELVDSYQPFFKFDTNLTYFSWTCSSISVILLLSYILLIILFNELRTLSSKLTTGIAITMIVGQIGLHIPYSSLEACQCIAFLTHFSWLSCFCWMSSQAVNMLVTFHPRTMQKSTSWHDESAFKKYFLVCTILPLTFVGVFFTLDLIPGDHIHARYGRGTCGWLSDQCAYIFGFFVPVGASVLLNIILFSCTLSYIENSIRSSSKVTGRRDDRNMCIVYLKLTSVMGFSWIVGFVASFVNVNWLWYVYVFLNGLQGLFIFLSFGVNDKVRNLIGTKLTSIAESTFWNSKENTIATRSVRSTNLKY